MPTTKIIFFRSQKLFLTSIPAAFMGKLIFIGMLQDSFLTGLPRNRQSSENLNFCQVRILYDIWVSSNLALDLVLKCFVIFGVDQLEKTSNLAMFGRFWYCSRFSLHEICLFAGYDLIEWLMDRLCIEDSRKLLSKICYRKSKNDFHVSYCCWKDVTENQYWEKMFFSQKIKLRPKYWGW